MGASALSVVVVEALSLAVGAVVVVTLEEIAEVVEVVVVMMICTLGPSRNARTLSLQPSRLLARERNSSHVSFGGTSIRRSPVDLFSCMCLAACCTIL